MLLIKFYANFCSFQRLYILKIGIQLKHEESIGTQSCRTRRQNQQQKTENCIKPLPISLATPAKFLRVAEFRRAANFRTAKLPVNLPAILFYFFVFLFYFFPNSPHVIVFSLYNFVICIVLVVYNTHRTLCK